MSDVHADCLTVFNYNTYLLEVSIGVRFAGKPNLEERADGIAEWFSSLSPAEMPDVVVLNEVYAYPAERLLQRIACKAWSKNRPIGGHARTFMDCDPESKFGAVTQVVNATYVMNPIKEGGVVILSKRGLEMLRAEERVFAAKSGSDALSFKGFWAVQLMKQGQPYWVLGTHAQAWQGADKAVVRNEQFKEMRAFVEQNVGDGGRVCFAGDMNTSMEGEDTEMCRSFGYAGAPGVVGERISRGFWLKLDDDLDFSMDSQRNHYSYASEHDRIHGSQRLDWIVAPGAKDRLATPTIMRHQYVPVKGNQYMASEAIRDPSTKKGTPTDDLSDHYGVYAQLWFGEGSCPEVVPVEGHRGVVGRLPCQLPAEVRAVVEQTQR